MKFNNKIQKHNDEQNKKSRRRQFIADNILPIIIKIEKFFAQIKLRKNIRNLEKLKRQALEELITSVEQEIIDDRHSSTIYIFRDADFEYGEVAIKQAFAGFFSNYDKCRKYERVMRVIDKDVDYDYFYNEIYSHFNQYEDLRVSYTNIKRWEHQRVVVSNLECISIERVLSE